LTIAIQEIDAIEMRFGEWHWPFIEAHQADIDENWAKMSARSARVFDGEVLLQHQWRIENGIYYGRYFKTRYRNFMGWRELQFPGLPVRNGFAMAALQSSDGAFLLGKMAEHTSNPGKIYFAAGTPDLNDIVGDRVDLEANVLRELEEETGLTAKDVTFTTGWTLVTDIGRAGFMRPMTLDLPAVEARAEIRARMQKIEDDELSDIIIVRSVADLDPVRMPAFVVAYLEHSFRVAQRCS
jgi:8-oxo-dGTP pyrophosphatase MutT (NUDIX family)